MGEAQYYGAGHFEHTHLQVDAGGKKLLWACLENGCSQKSFARSADLDRHYKQVHTLDAKKENFFCDYPKCSHRDAFRSKDHLREYHKEDLVKRGTKESWLEGRIIKPEWWRGKVSHDLPSSWPAGTEHCGPILLGVIA